MTKLQDLCKNGISKTTIKEMRALATEFNVRIKSSANKQQIFDTLCAATEPPKATSPKPLHKSKSPKATSPKPQHKSHSPHRCPDIQLEVAAADDAYIKEVNSLVEDAEKAYSIKSLTEDITNPHFIEEAYQAKVTALREKIAIYTKLSKIVWQDDEKKEDAKKHGERNVNLNEVINKMLTKLHAQFVSITSRKSEALAIVKINMHALVHDPDNGLKTIIGKSRENIQISLVKLVYMFIKVPKFFYKGFINFMITGPAGSGKTKIGSSIAFILSNLGILMTSKVIFATKQNLVGQFVGHSGPKTRAALSNALEGVFFIDEAYTLTACPGATGNHQSEDEAVGELINFLDKFVGCIVVIVAGYKDKMYKCFLKFNEGMSRRFPKVVDLQKYTSEDLNKLLITFMSESLDVKNHINKSQLEYIYGMINSLNTHEVFNNQAGDMLNLSKVIGEDVVLNGKNYTEKHIKLSFQKFLMTKNVAIKFK